MSDERIRFTDVLTTGAAVATYLGAREVTAAHLRDAVEILQGMKPMEALGRPVSPLIPRPPSGPGATAGVRELAQRWFAALGGEPLAELDADQLAKLMLELAAIDSPG